MYHTFKGIDTYPSPFEWSPDGPAVQVCDGRERRVRRDQLQGLGIGICALTAGRRGGAASSRP